jgi:hypothetical protein
MSLLLLAASLCVLVGGVRRPLEPTGGGGVVTLWGASIPFLFYDALMDSAALLVLAGLCVCGWVGGWVSWVHGEEAGAGLWILRE